MAYTIRLLPRAEFDAQQIYDWIKERSPDGARHWWLAFEEACNRLEQHPLSHALAPEAERFGGDVRQILLGTRQGNCYRALYVVAGNEVRILRLRGPGQPDLIEDEMM